MTYTEPADLLQTLFERVWNQGELAAIDEMVPLEGVAHGLADSPVRGPEPFKEFVKSFREAIPDIHVEVLRTVAQGPFCAAHCLVTGTHRGNTLGVPATGRTIRFEGMTIVRVENGHLREGWNSFDFLSLYQQIGMLPKIPG